MVSHSWAIGSNLCTEQFTSSFHWIWHLCFEPKSTSNWSSTFAMRYSRNNKNGKYARNQYYFGTINPIFDIWPVSFEMRDLADRQLFGLRIGPLYIYSSGRGAQHDQLVCIGVLCMWFEKNEFSCSLKHVRKSGTAVLDMIFVSRATRFFSIISPSAWARFPFSELILLVSPTYISSYLFWKSVFRKRSVHRFVKKCKYLNRFVMDNMKTRKCHFIS